MPTPSELIADRGKTHGDWDNNAEYSQSLKEYIRRTHKWGLMTRSQREALDMIMHKISRILAGDPDFRDHWLDIAGYAQLLADRCIK